MGIGRDLGGTIINQLNTHIPQEEGAQRLRRILSGPLSGHRIDGWLL